MSIKLIETIQTKSEHQSNDPSITLPVEIQIYESGEVCACLEGSPDEWYPSVAYFESVYAVSLNDLR